MNCHIKQDISLFCSLLNRLRLSDSERSKMERYYIIYWSGEYLEDQISPDRTVTHQDVTYPVLFWPSGSQTMPAFNQQCALSFRKPKPETGLPPICLIRII